MQRGRSGVFFFGLMYPDEYWIHAAFKRNCLKKVNMRITAGHFRAQLRDYSHLFLQMEQFDKIGRNLSEILYIYLLPRSRCVGVHNLLSFYSLLSFIFSPPPSPSFFLSFSRYLLFHFLQAVLPLVLFFSISFSLTLTHAREHTHTHTQYTSANRLVIQIHGCVSFHPW